MTLMEIDSEYTQWLHECVTILINYIHYRRLATAAVTLLKYGNKHKKQYKKKQYWIADIFKQRHRFGFHFTTFPRLLLEDLRFRNYIRMSPSQFEELLQLIAPRISKQDFIRESIKADERLAMVLRYLASGDSMTSMSYLYLIGLTTVSNIILETCTALWEVLSPLVLKPCSEIEWKNIAKDFEEKWNFPHCVGAIDGKHVVIQCPDNAGSEFYNYKSNHSVVLLAVCDANYIFRLVDIGAPGRRSDGGIFKESSMGQILERQEMNIPPESSMYEGGPILPYVFVGDEAFPLKTYMTRPYPRKKELSTDEKVFNYRLGRARRTIENTFGILAAKWRIYRKPILASLKHVDKIIQSTLCLHNWLRLSDIDKNEYVSVNLVDLEDANGQTIPGSWRITESNALRDLVNCSGNNYSRVAAKVRENYTEYFSEEGAVSWQFVHIFK